MIAEWVKHPITQEFLNKISDILQSNKEYLNELIINGPSLGVMDLHALSNYKGQILALQEVLNTKEFLYEITEESNLREVRNESQSNRP